MRVDQKGTFLFLTNLEDTSAGKELFSVQWPKDNRMFEAGEKNKLLVIGTKKLKELKLTQPFEIKVDGKEVLETRSEKLLFIVVNIFIERLGERMSRMRLV